MAKVYLISYANNKFIKNQDRLNKSASKYGINNIISYTDRDLKRLKFYNKYKDILDSPRGAGYWLWKPLFIYNTMKKLEDGDILIYADSGAVFINGPSPLINMTKENDILLFTNNEPNIKWNKRMCLHRMGCDTKKYFYSPQVSAGFQIYVNNERTRKFVLEWLRNCCIPNMINDNLGNDMEYEEYALFREHRHDQSILTNLAIKYNIPLHRDPSQGGNHLKKIEFRVKGEWLQYPYIYAGIGIGEYPTIINHLRNSGRLRLAITKIHSKLPRFIKLLTKRK